MLIFIPTLIFSISNLKSISGQIWAVKVIIITFVILFSPSRLHYCNLGHCVPYVVFMFCDLVILLKKKSKFFVLPENWQRISWIMILIPTLVFCISNPKSIFREIWSEKVKANCYLENSHTHTYIHTHTHTHTHTHICTHTHRVS